MLFLRFVLLRLKLNVQFPIMFELVSLSSLHTHMGLSTTILEFFRILACDGCNPSDSREAEPKQLEWCHEEQARVFTYPVGFPYFTIFDLPPSFYDGMQGSRAVWLCLLFLYSSMPPCIPSSDPTLSFCSWAIWGDKDLFASWVIHW